MSKNVLVAPLNWGLGHAARCIPLIKELQRCGFTPILASDGMALSLLEKEFPDLTHIALPSYNIQYSKKGTLLKWKLLWQSPSIMKAVKAEQKLTSQLCKTYNLAGIISDNRFGIYSKDCPSVFITHQLQVPSGITTLLTSKFHSLLYRKFDECWIPDRKETPNLSGRLGHQNKGDVKLKYIGSLSRFQHKILPIKHDLLIVLSGPEPQRSLLEKQLLEHFSEKKTPTILVRGVVESKQRRLKINKISIYNFMTSEELETAFNSSEIVLARSGYTTIMDLCKLKKKAFFIPTPGQFEQTYLAKHLEELKLAPSCSQKEFRPEQLERINNYKGMSCTEIRTDFNRLFSLFEGK